MTRRRKTTEEFIQEAIAANGNKYIYDNTKYTHSGEKVSIECRVHGQFFVLPAAHLKHGCKKCAVEEKGLRRRKKIDYFLEQCKLIHGTRYDYSETQYVNAKTKVAIICREHGKFYTLPNNHLKANCPACSIITHKRKVLLGTEKFIFLAKHVHFDKYDYSSVKYTCGKAKVLITCPVHGGFKQSPEMHLKSAYGCPKCADEATGMACRSTTQRFIESAKALHGDKYLYNKVDYKTNYQKVTLVCKTHGDFDIAPHSHLRGSGCSACSKGGFSTSLKGSVYILESQDMFKVGITNKDVTARLAQINRKSPQMFEIVFYEQGDGVVVNNVETKLLNWLQTNNIPQPIIKFSGSSECFYKGEINIPDVVNKLVMIKRKEE